MKDLAVVLITCDKYSFLWDTWYHNFSKYWIIDCPVYFLTETRRVDYPGVTQIWYNEPDVNKWTKRVKKCIKQIPENDLFVILDDHIFRKEIDRIFRGVYSLFKKLKADAIRINRVPDRTKAKATTHLIMGDPVYKLTRTSMYIISYTPNLWKKSFLLKCLMGNNDPWQSELLGYRFRLMGSRRLQLSCKVYGILYKDWFVGITHRGNVINEWEKKGKIYEEVIGSVNKI